ncbi:hypothetical protein AM588_10005317 [Phytophthora nicotianae]|uniref:Uncharacterized protein n=1 Tax=Phytophthora nicotianae TaxID=4792 RepID=A0A0W8DG40_PHYNI|nr:hypothetical protein AM588_10005317 [Phytophthora nicotianae]
MRSSSADAKVVNFCLLEPTLHNLNIKFDANVAVAIMNEKKDAAANLLYQIKMAAARVGRAPGVSTKSLERTGIIPLHNRPMKLSKPIYDSETHKLFEHSIRRQVRSIISLQQENEKDIQDELDHILVYKEIARENRSMRNQEYANQQELDSITVIDRDTSCYHNLLLRFEDDSEMQTLQRNDAQVSIEAADGFLNEFDEISAVSSANRPVLLSHQQLRILIFGPPFAGKETQAKLLGETHNLVVLSVHELIQTAVQNLSEIGQQVNDLLSNGKEIPPELYSRLVIDVISEIETQALTQDSNSKAGWVVYDLPATARHGQNLEEHLTGYKDPADISSPYDFESAIAPGRSKPPLSLTFLQGKSGIDLVFHLDCPIGTVLDRCLGRVEDIVAGVKRHLVFDPPPDDSTERHRLQHVNPSAFSSELLSLHCWASDGFMHDHKTWYSKFNTLHEPSDAEMTADEVHEAVSSVVDHLLKERQDEVNSKQLQHEADEQIHMSTEDERQRRLDIFESELDEAKVAVIKTEASIAEAEEAKAKKEEMAELRQKLEEAQRHLDGVLAAVKSWMQEEISSRPVPNSKYSGELVPAIAQALAALWDEMEAEYITTMKTSFARLREQRNCVTERAQLITSEFCEFVRRPDRKQEIVNEFQRLFNEVVDEMRFDNPTKVELHARADILQDELVSLIETKTEENDEGLSKTPSAPIAAGKAAQKGKVKAPAPAVVAPTNVAATSEDAMAESLTMTELLAEYGHVLQRCGSWMEAIAPIANDATQKTVEGGDDIPDGDFCKVNLLNGIKYEHDLMERRVRFLQEATEKSRDEITRSMRSIEITLRDFSENRRIREQAAAAAVIEYIRASIESEVALPSFIDISVRDRYRLLVLFHGG